MIRTTVVQLTVIPAVAYRQKLTSGGSGIVIVREGISQPGIASISKTSGEAIPTSNTRAKDFPKEAFAQAMELTAGLPYKKLGAVSYSKSKVTEEKPVAEPELKEVADVVSSKDYKAIVKQYADKSGKLSYDLLNRDVIKFSRTSSKVRAMIAALDSVESISLYVTGSKYRAITGNRQLTDAEVLKITELLDEVSPKGVYKDFDADVRARLKDAKKAAK